MQTTNFPWRIWLGGFVTAAVIFWVSGLGVFERSGMAQQSPESTGQRQPDESRKIVGGQDTRLGLSVPKDGAAVVTRWKNFNAYFVGSDGTTRDLGFKLRHQFSGVAIPSEGMAIIQDIQGNYYAVSDSGAVASLNIPR